MTPIYDLIEWAAAQSAPWIPHNIALRALEAANRGSVLDRDLADAPAVCDDGACYLVAAGSTGGDPWDGHAGEMAVAVGEDAANGWIFVRIATEGQFLWIEDEAIRIQFVAAAWETVSLGLVDLDSLGDVDAAAPADGDVLTFDSGSGDWVPAPAPGSGSGITELTGEVIAGPGTGAQAATIANGVLDVANFVASAIVTEAEGLASSDNDTSIPTTAAVKDYVDTEIAGVSGGGLSDGDKGDITVGSGGTTLTIDNDAVSYAKMQNVSAASKLLGRGDSGSGDVQEITLGSGLSMSGTTLSASGGGGSAAWTLAGTFTWSTNVTQIDFTGLGAYSELLVIARNIRLGTTGVLAVVLSTNNGSSFFTGSSDYEIIAAAGTPTTAANLGLYSSAHTTADRNGAIRISPINAASAIKIVERINRAIDGPGFFVGSLDAVNAIRLVPTAGGNITAGSVSVFAR